ncbi:import inner membrane translocase subunit [Perilla frutescens var. hirtella]|nr:import inner membrane translocase subunit [Perilla frutescens var. hirtella]KAH6812181.1 import inner membrane translocase subunit [Perilla frutescens var. frutescens]
MYRSGFGMKNKLSNILRSSLNGVKRRPSNAVTHAGFAQFSSLATESSLVAHPIGGNCNLARDEWARKHALVYLSPFQLSASAGQHMSHSCFARSFASQATESNKSKKSQTRKEVSTVEDPFDSPTYNIPEKPVTFTEGASYTLVILAGLGIAGAAAYAVCKELIFEPKEYKIFNKTLERVQTDSQVRVRIGSPITGYGSDSRNRAARQRVPHKTWTDDDGVEHVLVNFHIRGPQGAGRVYSEMFKDKVDKEWKFTYLIVEVTSPSPTQLMLESYIPA